MTGPVNVKKLSTLHVKSGRSGKCENNSTLNVKKVVQLHDQSVWTIWSAWSVFFGIFGFRGVNIPKVEKLGKCHAFERNCKSLIQEWAGGHFLGVLDVKK